MIQSIKNLESMNRNKRISKRKFLSCAMFLLCILATILVLIYPYRIEDLGAFFKRQLDVEFVPTAEYMLGHPIHKPEFINSISPPIGTTIEHSEEVCVGILPGALSDKGETLELETKVAGSLRIVINNQVIPRDAVRIGMARMIYPLGGGRFSGLVSACFTPELDAGIHIFRVEMRNSPLGMFGLGEYFSYSWVYQVR